MEVKHHVMQECSGSDT